MVSATASGYAPVNGIKMYYEVYGSGGIPLVLIHGGGSTIESTFGNFIPLISGHGQLVAVELQAHGRTSDRDGPESFEQDADDVATLLNYLKIDKANILGFSNGGTTTLQIAIRHPELVNSIIVVSANYRRDGMIEGFFESMPDATLNNMLNLLREAFLRVTPDRDKLQVMFEKDRDRMISFKDIPDELITAIAAPALLMVADQDVMTVEHVTGLYRLIKGSRLAVLPGTHGSFIGEICSREEGSRLPEMAAQLALEFLSK